MQLTMSFAARIEGMTALAEMRVDDVHEIEMCSLDERNETAADSSGCHNHTCSYYSHHHHTMY